MSAWLSLGAAEFLALAPDLVVARLAEAHARRFRGNEPAQIGAWEVQVAVLRRALGSFAAAEVASWRLLLEFDLLRLERRIDAVLLTDRAIL